MEYRRYERSHYGGHVGHLCGNGNQQQRLYGNGQPNGNGGRCSGCCHYGIGSYHFMYGRLGNPYGQRGRHLPMEYRCRCSLHYHGCKRHLYRNGNGFGRLYGYRRPNGNHWQHHGKHYGIGSNRILYGRFGNAHSRWWRNLPMEHGQRQCRHYGNCNRHLHGNGNGIGRLYGNCRPVGNG